MIAADVDAVMVIEDLCFRLPWSRDAFLTEVEKNLCARYFVALYAGNIVGYGGIWLIIDEAHVTNIAVHPSCRKKGIGQSLLLALMEEAVRCGANAMTLEVRVSNHLARNLYNKFGFEAAGIRKKYYGDNNEDALIMWKILEK